MRSFLRIPRAMAGTFANGAPNAARTAVRLAQPLSVPGAWAKPTSGIETLASKAPFFSVTPSEEKEFVIEEATADPAAADREAALQSLSNKLKSPVAERPALSASLGSSHLPNGTPFNVTWLAQRHGSSLYDLLRDAPTDFPAMVDSLSDARSGTLVATIDGTVIGYAHFASPTPYVNFEYFVDQHRYEYSAVALARLEINPAFKEFQAPLQDSLQKALSVSAHHCGYKAVAWEQRPAAGEDISWTLAPVHSGPVRAPAAGSVHAS